VEKEMVAKETEPEPGDLSDALAMIAEVLSDVEEIAWQPECRGAIRTIRRRLSL
jgi:hypothetical protein